MPVTPQAVSDIKLLILAELSTLNTISQGLDVLVAGNVTVDRSGAITIPLTAANRTGLKVELQARKDQLDNISTALAAILA